MEKLVINRNKWNRGKKRPNNVPIIKPVLADIENNLCILGFYLLALGYTVDELLYQSDTNSLERKVSSWIFSTQVKDTHLVCEIWLANDAAISESSRESRLTELFARKNIQIEFEN